MKHNFLGIECNLEDAEYLIVPIPYEVTTTCFGGTYYAPWRILEASKEIEDYLPELDLNTGEIKIHTLSFFHPPSLIPEEAIEHISQKIKEIVNKKKIPIIIGGEHTITWGCLKAFDEDTKVVFVDAHLDFYDRFHGEKICHATVGKRIAERHRIVHIGGRAYETVEGEELSKHDVIFLPMKSFFESQDKLIDWISRGPVYLSIDFDILSPQEGISVGNPVPEGWTINELLHLINFLILNSHIAGIDFCEYRPSSKTGDILVSKIIQKTLAFMEISNSIKISSS
jgi:agmatinase